MVRVFPALSWISKEQRKVKKQFHNKQLQMYSEWQKWSRKQRCSVITVFTRISAAVLIKFFAPQMQRLFEGGAYLKIGRNKEIFSFNLSVYFLSVRKFYSN